MFCLKIVFYFVGGFCKKYLSFPAFCGFVFLIFRFPPLFIVFLSISSFLQLPKGLFQFPQILNCVFWFPPYFPIFPGFRDLKIADVFSDFPQKFPPPVFRDFFKAFPAFRQKVLPSLYVGRF